MFSVERITSINEAFEQRLPHYKGYTDTIREGLQKCDSYEGILMKYLYGTMPLSDGINYDFDMFLDYARHGVRLRETSLYSKDLDEDVFLNYVVYPRINEEEISSCRTYFFNLLQERIEGKALVDAVREVNYWCCEEVTYQSTDERTASALTVFNGAYGRCGEESTFTVSALRSVGIPARQVYAPRWSHCDDNHAWVEVYVEGKWYFLGACEPEEVLNKGWFTNASSRAMLVHSRWFDYKAPTEACVGEAGNVRLLSNIDFYAKTVQLHVQVVDEQGTPVDDAQVDFEVLNYAEFYPIATLDTDEQGVVQFTTGIGSLKVVARDDKRWASQIVDTHHIQEITLALGQKEEQDVWEAVDMIAPIDTPIHAIQLTTTQQIDGKEKFNKAIKKRQNKVDGFFKRWPQGDQQLIEKSRGNYIEIQKFLEDKETQVYAEMKEKLLSVLSKKDFRDAKSSVLLEHLKHASRYSEGMDESLFIQYVLNPRIHLEPMTTYRHFIEEYYSGEEKQCFRENPKKLWEHIVKTVEVKDAYDYPNLVTAPRGALTIEAGNKLSQKILFVAVCRTLGIPARLNPIDLEIEYYHEGAFVAAEVVKIKDGSLQLVGDKDTDWVYTQNWSLGKWENNSYTTLNLRDIEWTEKQLTVQLERGQYRLVTSNRLPNGNSFAYTYTFTLGVGESKSIQMKLREAQLSEMLDAVQLPSFEVKDREGNALDGKSLIAKEKQLFIWLEVSKEPTEHILNELYAYQTFFKEMQSDIYFFIKNEEELTDPTLAKVIGAMPNVSIYFDTFEDNIEMLARRMYVDPDKLPLIMVTQNECEGLYATTGYNVGTGDMLLRIFKG